MAEKIVFSHEIDGDVKDLFDGMADSLPGNKYQLLEAMIQSFATLPRHTQVMILAGDFHAWEAAAVVKAEDAAREVGKGIDRAVDESRDAKRRGKRRRPEKEAG